MVVARVPNNVMSSELSDERSQPLPVTDESEFDQLINSEGSVLVDYYADWCGPCKMMEPVLEEIAAETEATVAKVDVDQHQGLAAAAGVRGVPTLELYVDGELVTQRVGYQDASQLRELLASN